MTHISFEELIKEMRKIKEENAKLQVLAYTDKMTGVFNRTFFEKWIEENNSQENYPLLITSLDLNNLKKINDTFGHKLGDEYIKGAANILKQVFGLESVICRIGGDEFVIITPNIGPRSAHSLHKELQRYNETVKISNGCVISYSFGSIYSEHWIDVNDLIKRSDAAMYHMKEEVHKKCARGE
jgi:diguanylate cyclase (GGDEF)-like protein